MPTITGAYLLGFDVIRIVGKSSISINDRENVRGSMRKLVGLEIIDEDATNISVQFLLDETSINPQNILKRMSSIALGMFNDVVLALKNGDKTNLETIANRDAEINRQYFLLVRLIRSTIMDTRLAGIFNLENIDILDYRIAANTLEIAGDTVVELSKSLIKSNLSKKELKKSPSGTCGNVFERTIIRAGFNNPKKIYFNFGDYSFKEWPYSGGFPIFSIFNKHKKK